MWRQEEEDIGKCERHKKKVGGSGEETEGKWSIKT